VNGGGGSGDPTTREVFHSGRGTNAGVSFSPNAWIVDAQTPNSATKTESRLKWFRGHTSKTRQAIYFPPRPSVYYEAGYAFGQLRPVVYTGHRYDRNR
jgi:hypothetical protein